ncbi:PREDICTED: thylakoid lumenal 15 kDa protein 1, chloroplastic isoform X2 [Tarenaya hassleriana]|uniref:thylakoid lumenal 15 kDa protein 1, chloroplastic isoform X2 n=1 Tax=Tarenaya hassleriana TaxID=28532 RepID=UPI0008FCF672|nr:PREDICTED: thylakoid lumenal 15 kDa protein 1, chloroplastic isoform X2 [Tarenaya hassleriana]
MAFLSNISLPCINIPPKLSLSLSNSVSSRSLRLPFCSRPQELKEGNGVWSLGEGVSKMGLLALVSASLFLVDPALAFKGGGPYGQEVTRGQDLTGKDFSGKTLIRQDFKTSILRQANFKGANLLGASFFDADLTDADLRGADLSLANFAKTNLTNANLEGALATGNTSFKGSNITGADFTDVPLRDDQREYLCKIADGVNLTTGNATRETLLCR